MDAVEEAIIKEQPHLDNFSNDDNPDIHTAACMQCVRDSAAPFVRRSGKNQLG